MVSRPLQGITDLFSLADIAEHQHHANKMAVLIADRRGGVFNWSLGAIPPDNECVIRQSRHFAFRERPGDRVRGSGTRILLDYVEHVRQLSALSICLRPAGQLLGDRVHEKDTARGVRRYDRVADARQCHLQTGALGLHRSISKGARIAQSVDEQRGQYEQGQSDHQVGSIEVKGECGRQEENEDDQRRKKRSQQARSQPAEPCTYGHCRQEKHERALLRHRPQNYVEKRDDDHGRYGEPIARVVTIAAYRARQYIQIPFSEARIIQVFGSPLVSSQ